ncbi:MAG: hypothetical protein OHK0029_06700 [Armatimonadaceae bacterium]
MIELLVVIAIIAILAAILFPVFAQAREKARQASCSSNMRQLGIAIRMYVDDFDGEMPVTSHDGRVGTFNPGEAAIWVQSLSPYTAKTEEIRGCPSDLHAEELEEYAGTSYVMNEYVSSRPRDPFTGAPMSVPDVYTRLDSIPRPSETFMLFELSDNRPRDSYWDHTHSRSWFASSNPQVRWLSIIREIEVDRHGQGGSTPERGGVANYLYCDAHVKAIPAARIKGWADQGFNFAQPPR